MRGNDGECKKATSLPLFLNVLLLSFDFIHLLPLQFYFHLNGVCICVVCLLNTFT